MKPNIIKILLAVFVLAIVGLVSCLSLSSTRQPDKEGHVNDKKSLSDTTPSTSETSVGKKYPTRRMIVLRMS